MISIEHAVSESSASDRVEFADPDEAVTYLEQAYGAKLRLTIDHDARRGPFLRHARTDSGDFAVDHLRVAGDVSAAPDALGKVVVVAPSHGQVSGRCDGMTGAAGSGEVTMLAQPDLPSESRSEDASLTTVLLDTALFGRVAGHPATAHALQPLRFTQLQPIDAAAARLWRSTVDYVANCVLADDAVATPLVLGHAGRLLAAVTLAAFPNNAVVEEAPHDRTDHQSVLLRRAMDYIEEHASADIALGDIASAVHVSPRAVQYMFRRHLETTPLQYLRQLRLHHAHQDLLAGDRVHDTVTAIAARWGFAHTGRFAVAYREVYGQSPHATLKS